MEKIKRHFEEEAEEFDGLIRKLIPYYPEMVEALVEALPWEREREIRVIDLGCGTGTLALRVTCPYPRSRGNGSPSTTKRTAPPSSWSS